MALAARYRRSIVVERAVEAAPPQQDERGPSRRQLERMMWRHPPPEPEFSDAFSTSSSNQARRNAPVKEFWFAPEVTREEAGLGRVPSHVEQWQRGPDRTAREVSTAGWHCPIGKPYRPLGGPVPLGPEPPLQLVRSMKEEEARASSRCIRLCSKE